jgi:tripartite ATP-independent transporter DctM subunit
MSLLIFAIFLGLGALGMPLAFSLGMAAVAGLIASDVEFNLLPSRMMNAINAFPLMSIPFFILAGELMLRAGMMERLIDLANAVVGRVRGGLAHVTMLAGLGLSTVSGAAVADASALGSTLMPSLQKHYGKGFSAAVCAAAANLGPIIPPSGAMIVYAFMAGPTVSVGGLFLAGIVPGLILVSTMMVLVWIIAKKRNYPLTGEAFSLRRIGHELKRSFLVFLMPVVVIGGIIGGAFTATEGSAIAVVFALLIGFFVTGQLKMADLPEALVRTAVTSAVVGAMIAFASVVTFMLTVQMTGLLQSITKDPFVFLVIVAMALFVVGMFLESNAAYIMLVPLLHPIALQYGIDPLHFGLLFVLNLVIGMITPPVGVVLFVLCGLSGLKLGQISWHVAPFVAVMYVVLLLCMVFPSIVLTLPRMMGLG